jgi:hypothetical protein
MSKAITFMCSGSITLLALMAQAQVTFRMGPKVGLNIATTRSAPDERFISYGAVTTSITSYRPGFEVGVLGSNGFGHFSTTPGQACLAQHLTESPLLPQVIKQLDTMRGKQLDRCC